MTLKALAASAALAAMVPYASYADAAENKALVTDALSAMFGELDPQAVDRYYDPHVIQHNPDIPNGSASQIHH